MSRFASVNAVVVENGVMLGLTPREARGRVDSVIDFAGLIVGLFALGFYVFSKQAPRIAEEL